ncbi:MAG: peptidylprolyl isomerase [Pseudomonadota bacterium]
MTHINRRINGLAIAVALTLAVVTACDNQDPAASTPRTLDGTTAALVNGEAIYVSDVELEAVVLGRVDPNSDFGPDHPEFQQILDQLIDRRLLAQEAIRRGLDQNPDAQRRLRAGRERLLESIMFENLLANQVTEEAIDKMYEEQVKLQQIDDEVRVRHILVDSQDRAASILQEIRDGRDFSDAVLEYSDDTRTRLDGGDFGWVSPNDMPDPFPAMIGNTVTGEVSEPFETGRGWHILKIDERRTTPPETKEEMRPTIITFLTQTQSVDFRRELRNNALIDKLDVTPRSRTEPAEETGTE